MKIVVSWQEHTREYSYPLDKFLALLEVKVDDTKIKNTVKKLLEQNEMNNV